MNTGHTPGRRPCLSPSPAVAFEPGSGFVAVAAQPASAVGIVPPGCGSYSGRPVAASLSTLQDDWRAFR